MIESKKLKTIKMRYTIEESEQADAIFKNNLKVFVLTLATFLIGISIPIYNLLASDRILEVTKDDLGELNHSFFLGYDLDAMAEFTAKHEGFRECAYYDLGGGWSIGYGTVSYEGECITEAEARRRLKFVLQAASEIVHGYTGVIPQDDMTALADTIFNVRPRNYDYILSQYHHPERKRELTYALSKMTRACYKGECTVYGGLKKRFEERINLLF